MATGESGTACIAIMVENCIVCLHHYNALQNLQLISAKSLLYYVTGMSCMRSCLPILIPIVVTVGGPCRVYVQ